MIFSENRYTLFRIMFWTPRGDAIPDRVGGVAAAIAIRYQFAL